MNSKNNQENVTAKFTVSMHVESILYLFRCKVTVLSKSGHQCPKQVMNETILMSFSIICAEVNVCNVYLAIAEH
jgi:hypothetical protein